MSVELKKGFWYYIKFPIYIITDLLGIMNHYDKNGQFKFNTEILDRQNSLAVRIDKLEKEAKKDA